MCLVARGTGRAGDLGNRSFAEKRISLAGFGSACKKGFTRDGKQIFRGRAKSNTHNGGFFGRQRKKTQTGNFSIKINLFRGFLFVVKSPLIF